MTSETNPRLTRLLARDDVASIDGVLDRVITKLERGMCRTADKRAECECCSETTQLIVELREIGDAAKVTKAPSALSWLVLDEDLETA